MAAWRAAQPGPGRAPRATCPWASRATRSEAGLPHKNASASSATLNLAFLYGDHNYSSEANTRRILRPRHSYQARNVGTFSSLFGGKASFCCTDLCPRRGAGHPAGGGDGSWTPDPAHRATREQGARGRVTEGHGYLPFYLFKKHSSIFPSTLPYSEMQGLAF